MADTLETNIKQRVEQLNSALSGEGFSYDENPLGAYFLDEEGVRVCRLSSFFVESVIAVPPANAAEIMKHVFLAHIASNERSFKAGKRAGRAEIVSTVHELLGIDKLQESLAVIETAMRESR